MNASTDKILFLLKSHGPQSAAALGEQLQMTSMGARQHLLTLEQEGWVTFSDEARGRGRPVRLWQLTEQAWQRFPDSHSDLTVQLIDNVRELFGEEGMERLILQREQQMLARYANEQDWWDLSVQATITAKMWDSLKERFPLAWQSVY